MSLTAEQLETIRAASEKSFPFVERCGVKVLAVERGYCKMVMPFEPNINHVGIMYAGALYTIAELPGGTIYSTSFDTKRFYPIVKEMSIRFRRPAKTDVTVEVKVDDEWIAKVQAEAEANGKADYVLEVELKTADGEVCALSTATYQLRAFGV